MGLPKFPPSCRIFVSRTLPETNSSHSKMDGWNTSFLLGMAYFQSELLVLERVSIDSPKVSLVPKMAVGASTLFTAVLGDGDSFTQAYLYS